MFNLTTINKKAVIILSAIVVLLVIATALVMLFTKKSPKVTPKGFTPEQIKIIQGKTVPLDQNIKKIKEQIIASPIRQNGGDKYLVQTREFTIVYVTTPDQFYVQINNEPAQENKKLAEKWFIDKGLTQKELCGLGVHFQLATPGATKEQIANFNTAAEGCPTL